MLKKTLYYFIIITRGEVLNMEELEKNINKRKIYISLLEQFGETVEAIESYLSHKKQVLKQLFTGSDLQLYKACSWFRNCCCFCNYF